MQDVGTLLGHDRLVEQLGEDLEPPAARVVRLSGPAGSGKSHAARLVATAWREKGGGCVVAVGDDEHSWRDLYPLLSGLAWAHADWAGLASTGARSALRLAEPTGLGNSIFDLMSAAFRLRTERVLKPYSDLERDVILSLKRLARSRQLLIVADNAHWWDANSLWLLKDILSEPLRTAIPRLESITVLLVDTAGEQPVVAPAAFDALAGIAADRTRVTERCTPEQFPALLRAFGLTEQIPDRVVRALYTATDGHLKLVEQVASYAEQNSVGTLFESVADDYVATLISARFASVGASSPEVTALLVRAAVLGLSFGEEDLFCMAGSARTDVIPLVERAESIGFLERDARRIAFSHDVIRSAILTNQAPSHLPPLYTKLSECLAILRPGDYSARAQALLHAGDLDRAREMLALASVAQLRQGVPPSRVLQRLLLRAAGDAELANYVEMMAQAYALVHAGDFVAAIPSLRTPLVGETTLMAAERNYLAAMCSLELSTAAAFEEAQAILSHWAVVVETEVELRLRFLLLLQQAQVMSELFDDARATERRIESQLLDRVRFDPDAAVMLQIQNRRAVSINGPEVAEPRIAEAVSFFRRGTGDIAKDRLELYLSLTNLSAIQIQAGKHADAYAHAQEAERIALDAPDLVRRLDVLASNAVLAGYRSGAIDLAEAIDRQKLLVDSPEGGDDKFLQRCNLAAYLLLASRDMDAAEALDRLGDDLHSENLVETYLVFYWTALTVASAALRGDTEEALTRHRSMDAFVEGLKWPTASYVRRRQRLLAELLPVFTPTGSRVAADRVLLDAHPSEVGVAWGYYGRLVPCCELSFWWDT